MVDISKAIRFFKDECLATNDEIKEIKKLAADCLDYYDKFPWAYSKNIFKYMRENPYEKDDKFYLYLQEIEDELLKKR